MSKLIRMPGTGGPVAMIQDLLIMAQEGKISSVIIAANNTDANEIVTGWGNCEPTEMALLICNLQMDLIRRVLEVNGDI